MTRKVHSTRKAHFYKPQHESKLSGYSSPFMSRHYNLGSVLAGAALADRELSDEEAEVVVYFLQKLCKLSEQNAWNLFDQCTLSENEQIDFDERFEELRSDLTESQKHSLVQSIFEIVQADGILEDDERLYLRHVRERLGIQS